MILIYVIKSGKLFPNLKRELSGKEAQKSWAILSTFTALRG
jgi:hypothetical protein